MTFKKWRAATAIAIAAALIGTGASSASAATGDILNPQPNGSKGSFYLFDGDTSNAEQPGRIFDRSDFLSLSASPTDPAADIVPTLYAPAWGTEVGDSVYKFVARESELSGGTNTWRAYDKVEVLGPNKGVWWEDFTLEGKTRNNGSGIESVFSDGGDWITGLAFTNIGGATVYASIYRTIHVEPGTGKFTFDPVAVEEEPAGPTGPTEADLTPALQTLTITAPTEGSTVIEINAGAANANKTFSIGAFSDRTDLGQITLDANGAGTIDVAGKGLTTGTEHKLFLSESDGTVVAWNTFTLIPSANSDSTDVTVEVKSSNRFEFVAPVATTIDLGDVSRDRTTAPVALGTFSVIDDRDVLLGWNLNINATSFAGPAGASIANTALGYAAKAEGGIQTGVKIGTAKTAGSGSFGVLVEGEANTTTTESGAHFNADLTFKAPVDAVKGAYNSTLTLDLVSK